jgi:hypothetical protein
MVLMSMNKGDEGKVAGEVAGEFNYVRDTGDVQG